MMEMELEPMEARVLGCLIEKEMATPDYYPLTLSTLVNACNQKSNRSPVLELEAATVEQAVFDLRTDHKLAVEVTSSNSRVAKYRHTMQDVLNFSPRRMAVLCELFVRGPQTPGDLRAHASRLHPLEDSAEVEEILLGLAEHEDGPFVLQLPREPGKRERRWAHLFSGVPDFCAEPQEVADVRGTAGPSKNDRIQALEEEVATLRAELDELTTAFATFRTAFE